MNKQPLFSLFIALGLGVFVQDYFSLDILWIFVIIIISMFSLLIGFLQKLYLNIFLLFFFFAIGLLCCFLSQEKAPNIKFIDRQTIHFNIQKRLNNTEKYKRYIINVNEISGASEGNISVPFKVIMNIPFDQPDLNYINNYSTKGYLNIINEPKNDYQFDYQKYMARDNVFYQTFIKAPVQDIGINSKLTSNIKQKRLDILSKINSSSLSKKSRDFLKGIILADRTDIDMEVTKDFRDSGLSHLLAISGAHMAIIFWFIVGSLRLIIPFRYKNVSIYLALLFICFFAVFIDYGSSVVRSCLMIIIYYSMVLLQRKPDLLHSIGLSGLIILICDPAQLFSVGFQLSYLAVFGIYWLYKPIYNLFPRYKYNFQKYLYGVASMTLAAQIITLPLILYYFHEFSLISIISNLVVIPFAEVVIVLSLIMTFILGFIGNIEVLNFVYDKVINLLLDVIHGFAHVSFLHFDKVAFYFIEVVSAYIIIYILRYFLIKRNYKYLLQLGYAILVLISLRLALDYRSYKNNELVEHQYFEAKIVSKKENGKITFYIKRSQDNKKIEKNIFIPYVISQRTKNYDVKYLD